MKISIPVNEEYETQVKIPKPILIEIFLKCGIENFLKISLISKQFYFLVKSDNLWMKLIKCNTEINEIELDSLRKNKSLAEIYRDSLVGWDYTGSHQDLFFNGNDVVNDKRGDAMCAISKKSFTVGEENVLFVFDYHTEAYLSSCGIKVVGV